MKSVEEIYKEYKSKNGLNYCEGLEDVFELMKAAQIYAYNQALEDAANKAKTCEDESSWSGQVWDDGPLPIIIDKQSILKLKK